MEHRIDVITLAVSYLERALAFYRDGLGLESPGVTATEYAGDETTAAGAIVMFRLDGGLILALYPRSELATSATPTDTSGKSCTCPAAPRIRAGYGSRRLSTSHASCRLSAPNR